MKFFFPYLVSFLLILSSVPALAQIGIGTTTPAASAALEVNSTTNNKGILIPRITATQKDAISNPAEGLMIFQTSAPAGFYYYTGTAWKLMVTQTDLDTKVSKVDAIISLNAKVDKVTGRVLSSNDFTSAEKTKLSAITGSNTGDQDLSSLATIASVALKANAADLTSGLANKVDKETGKELSSNDYTTAEKTKLAAITGANTGDQTNILGNAATATIADNVTGIVAIANGGTNSTAAATAGGIGYGTGTSHAYTGAGTSGQLLSSNGAGVPSWITPSAGGIPYTGATSAVDLGAYDLKVNDLTIGKGGGSMATNTAIGTDALFSNTTGSGNTANGAQALNSNTTGSSNTAIGYGADVATGALTNATAIGAGAIVSAIHTIQLGNTSVLNVKTSGTITAGAVTYPNISGSKPSTYICR